MKAVTTLFVALFLVLPATAAQDPSQPAAKKPAAKPAAKAAAEPFTFQFDRTVNDYDGCTVWGTVRSKEPGRRVKDVTVLLTALDAEGKLLGRAVADVKVPEGDQGDVGYVNDCTIDTGKKLPAKVECTIAAPPTYDDIEVVRSGEKTSSDAALEFELQKIGSSYSGLAVWGKVTNPTNKVAQNIQVLVTLYGPGGKFLGRGRGSANPGKVGPGQVGYVDSLSVDAGHWKPVKLEWKIITSEY